ncbi:MAG TPA: Uma2 family endonuclease [Roseiarcus sp.]
MRTNSTRAAEGFDRRSFTVAEILRMQDAGIIAEDENFELIEGEIVPMQAKTHVHELIKSALTMAVVRALPENLWVGVETTIYLSPDTFVEPDLVVYPRGITLEEVKGRDILLAIEVALTSLAYDRGLKAQLYARHGVRELWVVDAARRATFVHQRPDGPGWRSVTEYGPEEALTVAALPDFMMRLATI